MSLARPTQPPSPSYQAQQPPRSDTPPEGVYIISVAARMLKMHPQTLRKYERLGLVSPSRTLGMLRLYSDADIAKIRLIRHLEKGLGLNLAGVEVALNLLQRFQEVCRRLYSIDELQNLPPLLEQEMECICRSLGLSVVESPLLFQTKVRSDTHDTGGTDPARPAPGQPATGLGA